MDNIELCQYLKDFTLEKHTKEQMTFVKDTNKKTKINSIHLDGMEIPIYINEFWTSKQRQSSSIHEISYRACFKGQLPRFFIEVLTEKDEVVYDPFSGRGTTAVEAGLLGRNVIANDINPLSKILSYPRFFIPELKEIQSRLDRIDFNKNNNDEYDLSMFYHPETKKEIVALKNYLENRKIENSEDKLDSWIRMVATNRLTGHSAGFFSVYTLPPNQAVSRERQVKINNKRNQAPDYRNTRKLILKKSKSLIRNIKKYEITNLEKAGNNSQFFTLDARKTFGIENASVQLTVTSPPFLDIVQYSEDNWLRCWFNSINTEEINSKITMCKKIEDWCDVMQEVFNELYRITKPGGWVAFEVGEVKNGKIKLDEYVVPLGVKSGFKCIGIIINQQEFTKTSNIWGIANNKTGTNSNRIVLFYKNQLHH